jgi:SPP1 gp7 family putative phage head morphogenesis protein
MSSSQTTIGDALARYLAAFNVMGRLHIVQFGTSKIRGAVRLATSSRVVRSFAEAGADDSFDAGFSFELPAQGAIDYIRALTPVTKHLFDGLTSQYRNDAFTIAATNDQRVIAKVRDALADVLAAGGTKADFAAKAREITTEAGVEDMTAFELDTVFHTNTAKAYAAGRLEQMQAPHMTEALPYWQYWTVGDLRVRPGHAELDGFTARAIDPVWRRIYPPWDFNCRCSVVPIPADEAPPGSDEGGLERLGTKPLTMIELAQTDFRSLLGA